jgi:hypothetical protein
MDRLVEIFADMLRSVLAWEQEHGVQQNSAKIAWAEPLTKTTIISKVGVHENVDKGDDDDHENIGSG